LEDNKKRDEKPKAERMVEAKRMADEMFEAAIKSIKEGTSSAPNPLCMCLYERERVDI
jgi:hypothetical protein